MLSGPDPNEVKRAKELCEDLLANVKQQYEQFKQRGPSQGGGYGGRDGYNNGGYHNRGDRGNYGGGGGYGGGYNDARSPGSPAPASQTAAPGVLADYAAQYAQFYGGQDPYAAYGGYQNYVNMYYQYYQQQQAAAGQGSPLGASMNATPPPPGSVPPPPPNEAPPPPPPGGAPPGTGGYNAVRGQPCCPCGRNKLRADVDRCRHRPDCNGFHMRMVRCADGWKFLRVKDGRCRRIYKL